jgi:hypothetical protein
MLRSKEVSGPDTVTTTASKYDAEQLRKLKESFFVDLLWTSAMHFVTKSNTPLFLDPLNGVINMVFSPLFRIYVVGQSPAGMYSRPFAKKPGVMERILGSVVIPSVENTETASVPDFNEGVPLSENATLGVNKLTRTKSIPRRKSTKARQTIDE